MLFRSGADDYLAKPVQPRVLLAHIKAILRRSSSDRSTMGNDALQFGRLRINKPARDVRLGDMKIDLTTAEFDLLWLLASNAGRVLPRNEILKSLRGLDYDGIDRSIGSLPRRRAKQIAVRTYGFDMRRRDRFVAEFTEIGRAHV